VRVVLVHGTTQAPAGWQRTAAVLRGAGHEVYAIDLIGLHPNSTSGAYGEAAVEQIPGGRCDVVAAHSGGGLLLPAIARALAARAQVYVAAVIPDGVRSFADELRDDANVVAHDDWIGVDPTSDVDAARHFLFHDCDDTVTAWALTTLRSFRPTAVYDEVIAGIDIPAAAIVPTNDRTLHAEWMTGAARQRLGVEPVRIDTGHCPHVSRPQTVADTIAGVMPR
jgi:pimeloyl-ACP methyl ester carboxylesterase